MNTFFIVLFILTGFESETFEVSANYSAGRCGEIGWGMADSVASTIVPQAKVLDFDGFITSTTLFLAEVDSLAIHCVDTGYAYESATSHYEKTFNDMYYLLLNNLYHTQYLYESAREIYLSISEGFNGKDSAYYQVIGEEAGKIFYWSLYELIDDFSYPDIEIIYPDDFDAEKLEFFQ